MIICDICKSKFEDLEDFGHHALAEIDAEHGIYERTCPECNSIEWTEVRDDKQGDSETD